MGSIPVAGAKILRGLLASPLSIFVSFTESEPLILRKQNDRSVTVDKWRKSIDRADTVRIPVAGAKNSVRASVRNFYFFTFHSSPFTKYAHNILSNTEKLERTFL